VASDVDCDKIRWAIEGFGSFKSDHVASVAQSACLRDIWDIRAVKLLTEFVVVPPPVDTIFDFRAAYCSEHLPLKYEQLVLLLFGQHPRLTAVEQDWVDQGLMNGEFCLA
jgi:hypothetical protein